VSITASCHDLIQDIPLAAANDLFINATEVKAMHTLQQEMDSSETKRNDPFEFYSIEVHLVKRNHVFGD
jgi:hypothetical protein